MNLLDFVDILEKIDQFKFQIIAQNANDLIWVVNKDFKIEYLNKEVHKNILGYKLDEFIINFPKFKLFHPDEKEKIISHFKDLFKNKDEGLIELRIKHKNGSFIWFETKGTVFIEDDKKKALFISRDINQRKTTENLLRNAYNKLKMYERLLSHDIINIFQNIELSLDLIDLNAKKTKKTQEISEYTKVIKEQIERGLKLVDTERKLANIDFEFSLRKLEAIRILKKAKNFILSSYPNKNINIRIKSDYNEVFVKANEFLLDIFENLLMNAVKHNNNSKIEISINVSKNNPFYKFEFIDNGVGIEDERKRTLFTEVKDKKSKDFNSGGLGIGLTIIKSLIKKFEGEIWVENKDPEDFSKGSKFIIQLPIIDSK